MRRRLAVSCAALLALSPVAARSQGLARSMDVDASVRSAGMGNAANAVFWGADLSGWGNPALLGYARGIRFEYGRTELPADVEHGVVFTTRVLEVGVPGLGGYWAGPVADGARLDYDGVPGEAVRSRGFGASLFHLLTHLARLNGATGVGPSRYADLSFGMSWKDVEILRGPGRTQGVASDWGVHARITPIDRLDVREGLPLRIEAAYGYSVLSFEDSRIPYWDDVFRLTRHERQGVGLHVAVDAPALRRRARTSPSGWFLDGFSPLLSVGIASDWSDRRGTFEERRVSGAGAEVTLANVLSVRSGRYEEPQGGIRGMTWGLGVALPLGRVAGIRYDFARLPETESVRDLDVAGALRHAGAVWFDPLELRRVLRGGAGRAETSASAW
jgi:hypothetical protein